ncbi:MAG TPA: hypothetical protein VJP79_01955 [Nitrososphaera sp.]|nr:hypothetical protein [Nitrososphaera sp.]
MLDRFMGRLMESAANAYLPKIEEMAELRRKELLEIKAKVRTEPDAVESWFDAEIAKVGKIDPQDLFGKIT